MMYLYYDTTRYVYMYTYFGIIPLQKRGLCLFAGKSVHANKNPGRLLLLCIRSSRISASPCGELRKYGSSNDRGDQVRI